MLYRCYRWLNPNDWCFNPHDADFPYFSPTFLPSIRLLEVGVPLHLFIKNGEVAAFAVEILRGQARWMNSWGLSTKKTHFKWSLMNNPPNQYKQRKGKSRLKRFSSDRSYVTTVLETCGDSERCFFFCIFSWFFKWFQCFCSMVLNSIWIVWFNGSMVSLFIFKIEQPKHSIVFFDRRWSFWRYVSGFHWPIWSTTKRPAQVHLGWAGPKAVGSREFVWIGLGVLNLGFP